MYFVDGGSDLFYSEFKDAMQAAWELSGRRKGERVSIITVTYVGDTQIEFVVAYVESPNVPHN